MLSVPQTTCATGRCCASIDFQMADFAARRRMIDLLDISTFADVENGIDAVTLQPRPNISAFPV